MARRFLYIVAAIIVLVLAALLALRIWSTELTRMAFVPRGHFTPPAALPQNAYQDPALWIARPQMGANDPTRWTPAGFSEDAWDTEIPVFFVHPTSYLGADRWNAPVQEPESRQRAEAFVRAMASPFNRSTRIWAPRYRQAAFGSFLTTDPRGGKAIDAAYADVKLAFDHFLAETEQNAPGRPIVLAGHSQGALHVMRLVQERIAGTPLARRVATVYLIGWPVSRDHDLPRLGLPACTAATQAGCIMSWMSFAEPADPEMMLEAWRKQPGLDGKPRGSGAILCTNPLTGTAGGSAPAAANPGTVVPNDDLSGGRLVARTVPARCDEQGLLLIGVPPEMGRYVLPGNNYHVYDVPLFWAAVRADFERRMRAWKPAT